MKKEIEEGKEHETSEYSSEKKTKLKCRSDDGHRPANGSGAQQPGRAVATSKKNVCDLEIK